MTSPTFKTTALLLAQNARGAYDSGALQAQISPGGMCLYAGPCAIGASIPTTIAEEWDDNDYTVGALMSSGKLKVEGLGDDDKVAKAIKRLQYTHDYWQGADSESRPMYEAQFVEALEALEALVNKE